MRIALGQIVGTPADVEANLRLLEDLAERADRGGAELLLLPELFLTGYNIGAAAGRLAEPRHGPAARRIAAQAAKHGLAIAYGYAERAAEGVYNSAALVDAEGRLAVNYRKTHLWGSFERGQFIAGGACDTFPLGGLSCGLMICFDLEFPELCRSLALAGADLVIVLTATTAPYPIVPRHLVPTRAYENGVFLAFCNRTGEEAGLAYAGGSCVAAPDGALLASSDRDEALLFADLAPGRYDAYRKAHPYLGLRRPALYRP